MRLSTHRLCIRHILIATNKRLTNHTDEPDQELIQRRRVLPNDQGHGFEVVLEEDARDALAVFE